MTDSKKSENINPNSTLRESVDGVKRFIPDPNAHTPGVGRVQGSIEGFGGLKPYMPSPAKKDTNNEKK